MRTLLLTAVAALAAPSVAQFDYCESYSHGGSFGLRLNWRNVSIGDPGAYLGGTVQFVPYGGGIAMLVMCSWGKANSNPFLPVQMIYNEFCPDWREMVMLGWFWSHPAAAVGPGDYVTLVQHSNARPTPVPAVDLTSLPTGFIIYPVRMPVPLRAPEAAGQRRLWGGHREQDNRAVLADADDVRLPDRARVGELVTPWKGS